MINTQHTAQAGTVQGQHFNPGDAVVVNGHAGTLQSVEGAVVIVAIDGGPAMSFVEGDATDFAKGGDIDAVGKHGSMPLTMTPLVSIRKA